MSASLKPIVSVIMPAFKRARQHRAMLRSVLTQGTNGFELEVLVIDGNSTDGTIELASSIAADDGRVRLLHNPHRKTPVAMNLGWSARGEYVCILGAHAVYPPDYISVCLQELHRMGQLAAAASLDSTR